MTRIQTQYRLLKPLDERMIGRISDAHAIYGILRIRPDEKQELLTVEYDATRLRPPEVAAALEGAGIPVEPAN